MTDLISYKQSLPAMTSAGLAEAKQAAVGRLARRIKIRLSDGQFKALHRVLTFWLHNAPARGQLFEEAYYLSVYKLFLSKVQRAPFNVFKANITLSLDLCQANTLMEALTDYQFDNAPYELMTINYIIEEIDKQTV